MTTRNVLAGVMVKDWSGAQDFWSTVFGRRPDRVPRHGCAEWGTPDGGQLQFVEDATRAGSSSVTLAVDDVHAERERLGAAGATVPDVSTVPGFIHAVTCRCFPTAGRMRSQELVHVVEVAPGEVFVRYVYELHTGARHRNTEVITVRDGRVVETQVYFGAALV